MRSTRFSDTVNPTRVDIRNPILSDTAKVAHIALDEEGLDKNSHYMYALMCSHFSATSVVAVIDQEIRGFAFGYRMPDAPDTLFVWQIAVRRVYRGRGVAGRLLTWLLDQPGMEDVKTVAATAAPSNSASIKMFSKLAAEINADICWSEDYFSPATGLEADHPSESMVRIGPIPRG